MIEILQETKTSVVCVKPVGIAAQGMDVQALPQLLAACTRLRETRGEAEALRGKLDEARLISRAKLLLISRFKMSEDEAHRFLERSAMDNCTKLRNAAESVIRTYEE